MWDASLVIPKYIVSPHPALVETSEKFCKCTSNFVAPRIWWNSFVCGPLSTWPTQVSNLFSVGRGQQIYKNWTDDEGDNWGDAAKSGKNTHLLVLMRMRLLYTICWFINLESKICLWKHKFRVLLSTFNILKGVSRLCVFVVYYYFYLSCPNVC